MIHLQSVVTARAIDFDLLFFYDFSTLSLNYRLWVVLISYFARDSSTFEAPTLRIMKSHVFSSELNFTKTLFSFFTQFL